MATPNELQPHVPSTSRSSTGNRGPSLGEQTGKVADDVRELGHLALAGAGEAIQHAKERGNEALGSARERGEELLEKGRERMTKSGESLESYIIEHPFKSVLLAAGIGLLFGYMRR